MDEIRRQVAHARRRMTLQQFLAVAPWSLFVALLIAAAALAVPKIWALELDSLVWAVGWIGGGMGLGTLAAVVWTFVRRHAAVDAAIEIDRRFGLKERVSSALCLGPEELETEAGRALVADAVARVEVIAVGERFGLSTNWRALLPLIPALAVFVLALLVPDATPKAAKAASSSAGEVKQQIKKTAEELKKRLAKGQEDAEKKGLADAEVFFNKLHRGIDQLTSKGNVDRKQALVKMNDLAKELARRREALGDTDEMKKQFNRLKNIQRGPAEKVAQALKQGDFQRALEELKKLTEKLDKGELSEEEKEQLAQQLEEMQKKLQEMIDTHEQAKRDLERQIQQKIAEGDLETAGKLQRKLDQLEQQDRQMDRLQRMANQLGQCSQCIQDGNTSGAASQLDQMASELEQLQVEFGQLETLDELMSEIADAKSAMNCRECDGGG